jgi:hypothetical protein
LTASYADVTFYHDEFNGGFDGADDELTRLLKLASLDIDTLTFFRARTECLTLHQLELLQVACCLQADYLNSRSDIGMKDGISSYSVGGISVSYNDSDETPAEKNNFSARGFNLLNQTGLMWRGVR